MHRHRRCVQIMQDFTTVHGFDAPPEVEAAGVRSDYEAAMKARRKPRSRSFPRSEAKRAQQNAQYAIPFAFPQAHACSRWTSRSRLYLRVAHHARRTRVLSQRGLCHYEAVAAKYPALGKYFRVHDVREPVDLRSAEQVWRGHPRPKNVSPSSKNVASAKN